jgi:hypothetical protein
MSVRPEAVSSVPTLIGAEGELVSVHIAIEARLLERLLDALASVSFPVNPQIYHQAAVGYMGADGSEEIVPITLVEFPAFSGRVDEVRRVLAAQGLAPELVSVRSMLEELHSDTDVESAPPEAPWARIRLYKHLPVS